MFFIFFQVGDWNRQGYTECRFLRNGKVDRSLKTKRKNASMPLSICQMKLGVRGGGGAWGRGGQAGRPSGQASRPTATGRGRCARQRDMCGVGRVGAGCKATHRAKARRRDGDIAPYRNGARAVRTATGRGRCGAAARWGHRALPQRGTGGAHGNGAWAVWGARGAAVRSVGRAGSGSAECGAACGARCGARGSAWCGVRAVRTDAGARRWARGVECAVWSARVTEMVGEKKRHQSRAIGV